MLGRALLALAFSIAGVPSAAVAQDAQFRVKDGQVELELPGNCTGVEADLPGAQRSVSGEPFSWVVLGPAKDGLHHVKLLGVEHEFVLDVRGRTVTPIWLGTPARRDEGATAALTRVIGALDERRLRRIVEQTAERFARENAVAVTGTIVVCLVQGAVGGPWAVPLCMATEGAQHAAEAAAVFLEELVVVLDSVGAITEEDASTVRALVGALRIAQWLAQDKLGRITTGVKELISRNVNNATLRMLGDVKVDGAEKLVRIQTS